MKRLALLLSLMGSTSLHAASTEAASHFEAGGTAKARALWQNQRESVSSPWEKEFLQYNIGETYLAEKQWEKAIEAFQAISIGPESSPLLALRVRTNLAYAWLNAAEEEKSIEGKRFALEQALGESEDAILADCRLQQIKGGQDCLLDPNFQEMRQLAKEQFAALKEEGEPSVKQGILQLFSALRTAEAAVRFLEKVQEDSYLSQRYTSYWDSALESYLPLWKLVAEKASLEKARQQYWNALKKMREKNWDESQKSLRLAEEQLREKLKELFGSGALQSQIQELLLSYDRILEQPQLPESDLYSLEKQQEQLEPLASLQEASANLQEALRAFGESQFSLAKFYLESARYAILKKVRKKADSPKKALQQAIEDQIHALRLRKDSLSFENQERFQKSLIEAQGDTLGQTEQFLLKVKDAQTKEYEKGGPFKNWEEVLDSFYQGVYSAQHAQELLENNRYPKLTMTKQEQAIHFWREALRKLETPLAKETKPRQVPKDQAREFSAQEALRNLQRMEKDDRNVSGEVKTKVEVQYPW